MITDRVCSSATISSNKASPQVYGGTITFTATSSGCARPLYKFWIKTPAGAWVVRQNYSSSNTFAWATNKEASVGNYTIDVWVTAEGSPSAEQTFATEAYTLLP